MEHDEAVAYMWSFMAILVDRFGIDGVLTIEKLSEYSGRNLGLSMDLQKDKDRVVLSLGNGGQ